MLQLCSPRVPNRRKARVLSPKVPSALLSSRLSSMRIKETTRNNTLGLFTAVVLSTAGCGALIQDQLDHGTVWEGSAQCQGGTFENRRVDEPES